MKRIKISILFFYLMSVASPGQNNLDDYNKFKLDILKTRDSFMEIFRTADSKLKDSITNAARNYIFDKITTDIFNYWYGTQWSFYGQTTLPRKGTIACGYFVTTVLSDAGFNIPRIKWAQLASEIFIKKLTRDLKRFHEKPIDEVSKFLKSRGNGIYIVGLDCHVGFLYVKKDIIRFVHSNYFQPSIGVMSESLETNNPLFTSSYRILGRLLDDKMIINWIMNAKYE